MSKEKTTSKAGVDLYAPVDVCCGGTIPLNQNYVPFNNSTGSRQTVSNCSLFPGLSISVPTTPPVFNAPITTNPLPTAGNYSFTSTCNCPGGTLPAIKVQ